MIIDTLENAGKYTSVHPLFAKAFEFLNSSMLGAFRSNSLWQALSFASSIKDAMPLFKYWARRNPE